MVDYIKDIDIFHYYEIKEIDSTNTYLKNNYFKFPNNSVLLAHNQTNGRGRFDRKWISDNDICFSILYKNKINNTIIAPLAIVLALKEFGIDSAIKWPNDIYINNKKLAGILIEDVYENKLKASVVGIGINMYNKNELNGIGIASFKMINKLDLIELILLKYKELINSPANNIMTAYKKYSMVIGKYIIYNNKDYKAIDITDDGYLLAINDIERIKITSNEINFKLKK